MSTEPTDPTPEPTDADKKKIAALKSIIRFSRAGYAGMDAAGRIVDRRLNPKARPVPANSYLGFPKPKPLEGAPPPEEDPELEDLPPIPQPPPFVSTVQPHNRPPSDKAVHIPIGTKLTMKGGAYTVIDGSRRALKLKGPMHLLEEGAQLRLGPAICTVELKGKRHARVTCPAPYHFSIQPLPPR